MLYKLTFTRYMVLFGYYVFKRNGIKEFVDFAILKKCPICQTKLHKNELGSYNCAECWKKYLDKTGFR